MKVIGVTGGVGAGKSTVLEILKEVYGAKLLLADEIGRELMEPGGACFAPVVKVFGETVVRPDGRLDRGKIAELVFGDKEALGRLNGIIHPAVRREIEARLDRFREAERQSGVFSFGVIESAILLEAGYEEICEEIWYVHTAKETRISRLMETRGYTRERCLKVMESQMEEEVFKKRASAILENDGSMEQMRSQIKKLMV